MNIDIDTGYEHLDEGPWRSYRLSTDGSNEAELIQNAHIFEVDQYGGSLSNYPLEFTNTYLYNLSVNLIKELLNKENLK